MKINWWVTQFLLFKKNSIFVESVHNILNICISSNRLVIHIIEISCL